MGWDFTRGAKKQDIVNRLVMETERHFTVEHKTVKEDGQWVLWGVMQYKVEARERVIFCYLLNRSEDGWGYKDMCEGMHPYFYSCPLHFLDMTPPVCDV